MASFKGYVKVVEKLLQHGAKLNIITKVVVYMISQKLFHTINQHLMPQYRDSALIMACYKNDLTTASVLLRAGAYPNGCNKVQ